MKSLSTLTALFTNLTQNTSTQNVALAQQLINDQHRYLIQKYFDNERTSTTSTVGGMQLTLTGSLSAGAVSATLTAAWTYPTVTQLVTFSDGEQINTLFTNGSAAITWQTGLQNSVTSAISTVGVQYYSIPSNISKVTDFTVNVGQLKYLPTEIKTRREWDLVNFLPYTSDIPNYFFIYNGKLGIFPVPSTTGNIITFNYKTRVADLSFADVSNGTIAAAGAVAGSTTVTGSGTGWGTTDHFPIGVDIGYFNLMLNIAPPNGDGLWYPISNFVSDTVLTLQNPIINAPNIAASTPYTIGQMPLLEEDFADTIVYGALKVYFSSIVENPDAFKGFKDEYEMRLNLLADYAGSKTTMAIDLSEEPALINGNLFYFAP